MTTPSRWSNDEIARAAKSAARSVAKRRGFTVEEDDMFQEATLYALTHAEEIERCTTEAALQQVLFWRTDRIAGRIETKHDRDISWEDWAYGDELHE